MRDRNVILNSPIAEDCTLPSFAALQRALGLFVVDTFTTSPVAASHLRPYAAQRLMGANPFEGFDHRSAHLVDGI